MLILFHNGSQYPISDTEYYIREMANGLDECIFTLNIHDPIYALIAEEENVIDSSGQTYKVKQIDGGATNAKIICQLDIDAWKASMVPNYNSGSKTVAQQINTVCPAGWTVVDRSGSMISRTIEGDYTPYDVCVRCTEVYSVYIRWDTKTKTCTIYTKTIPEPVGAFATRELNLKEINYKGKSLNLITRLYAYGKDGMNFADINDNKPYVDNFTYTDRIICGIWRDERYTVKADLLADAIKNLAKMAVPERSYECAIVDLQATNPDLYGNLNFGIFTSATLIDDIKETAVNYQVVERHIFPYHPEQNEVIFDSEPQKITDAVVLVEDAIENPNSAFNQIQAQRIQEATNWLTSPDGYIWIARDSAGWWKEIYMMDTNDPTTATNLFRLNNNGIGISNSGLNGPYVSAWTIDGKFNCDWLLAGTINASLIRAGVLSDYAGKFSLNMITGALDMQDGTFSGTIDASTITGGTISGASITSTSGGSTTTINGGAITTNNITATGGYIGTTSSGWRIGSNNIHNGPTAINSTSTAGTYVGTDGILQSNGTNYTQITGGQLTATNVSLTGEIRATKRGEIGAWTLRGNDESSSDQGAGALYSGSQFILSPNGTQYQYAISDLYTGSKKLFMRIKDAFAVDISGNCYMSGTIYSKAGEIGGFNITNDALGNKIGSSKCVGMISADKLFTWSSGAKIDINFDNIKIATGSGDGKGLFIYSSSDFSGDYIQYGYSDIYRTSDGKHVQWVTTSDKRLKKDIEDLSYDEALKLITSVRPRKFKYKNEDGERLGFIAQELREILDEDSGIEYQYSSEECKDIPPYRCVNYYDFIAPICAVVKKQQEEIDLLKQEIALLKAKE